MKKILLIAFLAAFVAPLFGQFGESSNKFLLNYQTTSQGLNHYGSGVPNYTPENRFDTYEYEDTISGARYLWDHFDSKWKTHYYIGTTAPVEVAGPPIVTYREGLWYNPGNNTLFVWSGSNWVASAGGGISDFLGLTDTPGSYAGQGDNLVKVNAAETGLEFFPQSSLTITESQISDLNHFDSGDFDSEFGSKTTDDLAEGSTNLYFNGKTTDQLPEGASNFYYSSALFDTDFAGKTTTDLAEGTNLYYTQARFDAAFGAKTTDGLTEGGTNLYYTTGRFDSDFDSKSTDDLDEGAVNFYYSSGRFDSDFAGKSTTDLAEGSNLYFTNERADDRFNDLIQNTTSIVWTYNDGANTMAADVQPNSTVQQINVEKADAASGTRPTINFVEGSNVSISVVDNPGSDQVDITIASTGGGGSGTFLGLTDSPASYAGQALELTRVNAGETALEFVPTSALTFTESQISDLDHYDSADFDADFGGKDSDDLGEGSVNFYYTEARFNSSFSGKTTTDLAEGSNLYYTSGRFDSDFAGKSTSDLPEGSNLYWTQARFNTALGNADTDDLAEGSTNLYFSGKDTDDLPEGSANLYYTSGRFDSDFAGKSTTDLVEGTNLYYTAARFDAAFGGKDTDDLGEGSTNFYYTESRFNSSFSSKSTSDLAEGSNLYYTDERSEDATAALIQTSSSIQWVYNDGAPTLTGSVIEDSGVQRTDVSLGGTQIGSRRELNFIQGTGATLSIVENAGNNRIDITIGATGAGGGEANTYSDLGGGISIRGSKTGVDLPFKTFIEGTNISIDETATTLTINSTASGGVTAFTALDDTPANYTGQALELTRVNAGETGLEFVPVSSLTFTESQITDLDHYDSADFDADFSGKSTSDLSEGTNLYYTQARFDAAFGAKDSDDLSEGSTNLYYTTARFNTDFGNRTTDNLAEGSSNFYYTETRFNSSFSGKSTTDLSEGTNLYWTQVRFDAAFSGKDSDDLPEGSSNLYFSGKDSDDLPEGSSNFYYTEGRFNTSFGGKNIGELSDVTEVGPVEDEVLVYNGTNWVNATVPVTNTSSTLEMQYSSSTGSADPGNGVFRFNNADMSSATEIYVSEITQSGYSWVFILNDLDDNDEILIQQKDDNTKAILMEIGTPVDNGTWWTIPITNSEIGSGGTFQNNRLTAWTIFQNANPPTPQVLAFTAPNLSISQGNSVDLSTLNHNSLAGYVAAEHINHNSVIFSAGFGLNDSGGGSIAASRSFALDLSELNLVSIWEAGHQIIMYDGGDASQDRMALSDFEAGLTITESQISDLDHYNSTDFDSDFAGKTTSNLTEGTNLYYTQARFDAAFGGKDSDDLSEGSSNLYYTEARFDASFSGKSTSDLSEGSNLYWTAERTDDQVAALVSSSATLNWVYNDAGGSLTGSVVTDSHVQRTEVSLNGAAVASTRRQLNFIEGSGATISVADNGGNNRTDITISAAGGGGAMDSWFLDSDDSSPFEITDGATLDVRGGLGMVTTHTGGIITVVPRFEDFSTGGLFANMEFVFADPGAGLERRKPTGDVQEWIEDFLGTSTLVAGTNMTINYDDGAGTITFDAAGGGGPSDTDGLPEGSTNLYYTDERVDDRAAALIQDGSNISWTYNDGANTLTGDLDYPALDAQTSGTVDLLSASVYHRIIDMGSAGGSITMVLNNPKDGGYYTFIFTNAVNTDIVTWPANVKLEDGTVIGTDVLAHNNGKRRIVSMMYDGTDFWTYYSE